MAKKKALCRDKRGLFVRNLGYKWTGEKYVNQKFYLGRDETFAKIASLKLEQLWETLCRRWEAHTPLVANIACPYASSSSPNTAAISSRV